MKNLYRTLLMAFCHFTDMVSEGDLTVIEHGKHIGSLERKVDHDPILRMVLEVLQKLIRSKQDESYDDEDKPLKSRRTRKRGRSRGTNDGKPAAQQMEEMRKKYRAEVDAFIKTKFPPKKSPSK